MKTLALLLVAALFVLTGCPATLPGQTTTAQKAAASLAKVAPILKDIGDGVKDLGTCALDIVETVAQALAGSPGWAATLIADYQCVSQGIAQLKADIAANRAPVPTPEHLQMAQTVIAVTHALSTVPAQIVTVPAE